MARFFFPEHYPRLDEDRLALDLQNIIRMLNRREISKERAKEDGERVLRKHYNRIQDKINNYLLLNNITVDISQEEVLQEFIEDWRRAIDDLS